MIFKIPLCINASGGKLLLRPPVSYNKLLGRVEAPQLRSFAKIANSLKALTISPSEMFNQIPNVHLIGKVLSIWAVNAWNLQPHGGT